MQNGMITTQLPPHDRLQFCANLQNLESRPPSRVKRAADSLADSLAARFADSGRGGCTLPRSSVNTGTDMLLSPTKLLRPPTHSTHTLPLLHIHTAPDRPSHPKHTAWRHRLHKTQPST